jgi:hypothetical protein
MVVFNPSLCPGTKLNLFADLSKMVGRIVTTITAGANCTTNSLLKIAPLGICEDCGKSPGRPKFTISFFLTNALKW